MKLQHRAFVQACLAASMIMLPCAYAGAPDELEAPSLVERLLALILEPGFELESLDYYVDVEKKAISTTHFGVGEIYDVPANNRSTGIGSFRVHFRDKNERDLVSVAVVMDASAHECPLIKPFARHHRLIPHPYNHLDPTNRLAAQTYYDGAVGNARLIATPHRLLPECIGEIQISLGDRRLGPGQSPPGSLLSPKQVQRLHACPHTQCIFVTRSPILMAHRDAGIYQIRDDGL